MKIVIDRDRCPQNHRCPLVDKCPVGAISQEGFLLPIIDEDSCIHCEKCVISCGMKAVYVAEDK